MSLRRRAAMESLQLNQQQSDNSMKPVVKRAIYSGLVAGVGSYFLLGEKGNVDVYGKQMMSATAVAGAVAAGSIVTDYTADWVVSKTLDQSQSIKSMEAEAIKLGLCGIGSNLAFNAMTERSLLNVNLPAIGVGAVSKFAGDGLYQQMDPSLLGVLF